MLDITFFVSKLIETMDTKNPFEISKQLDINILFTPLLDYRGYYKNVNGFDFIVISTNLNKTVQEFVCAHELGHYFFHKELNRIFMDGYTCMCSNKYENEADTFAAQLLWGKQNDPQIEIITEWEFADYLNIAKCNVNERLLELGIY